MAFLHPPAGFGFDEAFWHAIARSYVGAPGPAMCIARSKITRAPRGEVAFWRDVARFFRANPVPVETIDDLCDYLAECRRRDPNYSVERRTLASLSRRMHEWHRDIAAIERIEAIRRRAARWATVRGATVSAPDLVWSGSPLADWEWIRSTKDAKARGERFVVRQLKQRQTLTGQGFVNPAGVRRPDASVGAVHAALSEATEW